MVQTIFTERLVLRSLRPSDAGPISLHASDPRVAGMTASIPHPYPPGAAAAYIERTLGGRRGEDVWAIDATPVGGEELVGLIGYRPDQGELGYWVGPPYWNVGYATEAVLAVIAHLFEARGVEHLDGTVFADNGASAAVLAKAGWREIGRGSQFCAARGEAVVSRRFRLTRTDWAAALEPGAVPG
jgi:RimJ/RimL family protein N-acetyltransferase